MLIDIFIPTGEVRKPNKDEWYQSYSECWHQATYEVEEYPIGIRHQVEVPESCIGIDIQPYNKAECFRTTNILLPRPKKKVKKWQWVLPHQWGENSCFMTSYFTDDEVNENYPDKGWYHKISETEIEVSE